MNPTLRLNTLNEAVSIQPSLKIVVDDGVINLLNLEEQRMSVHLNDDMINVLDQNIDKDTKKNLMMPRFG